MMDKNKNYYSILEISETASSEVITAAYKILIRKHHPDVAGESFEEANSKVKLIIEAYEVLSDPIKKEKYDELLKVSNQIKNMKNVVHDDKRDKGGLSKESSATKEHVEDKQPFSFNYGWLSILLFVMLVLAIQSMAKHYKTQENVTIEEAEKTVSDYITLDFNQQDRNFILCRMKLNDFEIGESVAFEKTRMINLTKTNGVMILGRQSDAYEVIVYDTTNSLQTKGWVKLVNFSEVFWFYEESNLYESFTNENLVLGNVSASTKVSEQVNKTATSNSLNQQHTIIKEEKQDAEISQDAFTVGYSYEQVKKVMGSPSSYSERDWQYGYSFVYFQNGLVSGWYELDQKLKTYVDTSNIAENYDRFTIGSTMGVVAKVMGTPTGYSEREWQYGYSFVYFQNGLVSGWSNISNNLKFK